MNEGKREGEDDKEESLFILNEEEISLTSNGETKFLSFFLCAFTKEEEKNEEKEKQTREEGEKNRVKKKKSKSSERKPSVSTGASLHI